MDASNLFSPVRLEDFPRRGAAALPCRVTIPSFLSPGEGCFSPRFPLKGSELPPFLGGGFKVRFFPSSVLLFLFPFFPFDVDSADF